MDPGKQDALHRIENSIYRTAFKLRSVQTLCHLDLIDSSLTQHVLLHQCFWEARESPLSVQQLLQTLQELFQRVRVANPGQVHPRASALTLSLLTAMYDRNGLSQACPCSRCPALIALSGDSPLTKYRALFQLYAEKYKGGYDSEARMTRMVLRNLLTDLQQIPTVVGESRAPCSVESAVQSCFQGVLSPAVKEEKFLSWLQSEPPILLWLPTCYQLPATELVTHAARCSVCGSFPIAGLRYRCLKCLDFDVCQVCFLSGLHSKAHQKSQPVMESCVQQVSAKENTKLLLGALRKNLLQGRRGKQWLLDQVKPKGVADRARAGFSIQYNSSEVPTYGSPTGPVETATTEASKPVSQRTSQAQHTTSNHRTMVSTRSDLCRTHTSLDALHRERRLLKKRLHRHKDKLRAIYASQEEKSCRFQTKIHELTINQDSLWTTLQQMGQDLQAVLQPLHPSSSSCRNTVSKGDHGKGERFWRGRDSSQIKNATEDGSEQEALPTPTVTDKSHQSQANTEHAPPNANSPQIVLQARSRRGPRAQIQAQKTSKEIFSSLPSSQEGLLLDTPQIAPAEMNHPALAPVKNKETVNTQEGKDELEEEELQELLSKLTDAFTLETASDPQSSGNTELYRGAEHVCRAFSALLDHITLPNVK